MQGIFKIPLPDYFVFAKFYIVYQVVIGKPKRQHQLQGYLQLH